MVFVLEKSMFQKAPQIDRTMAKKAEPSSFTAPEKKSVPGKEKQVSMGTKDRSDFQGPRAMAPVGPCSGQYAHVLSRDTHKILISGEMRA